MEKTRSNLRKSNIELLRLVAMFLIIAGHFWAQSGASDTPIRPAWVVSSFLGSGSRIAVGLFLMIGAWFLVDHTDNVVTRSLKLYGQLWIYGIAITVVLLILGKSIDAVGFVNVFFPFIRRSPWYVPVYIVLLLISPILSQFFNLKRNVQRTTLLILTFIIPLISTVSRFMDDWLDCITWFCYTFLLIGYYKHYLYQEEILAKS